MPAKDDRAKLLAEKAKRTTDDLEARLLMAAAVAQAGREVGVRVVLTGGTAADFYVSGALGTSAGYPALWRPSGDIDLIVLSVPSWGPGRKALQERLVGMGMEPHLFQETAREFDVPGFPFYIELVADELGDRGREERTMTILLDGEHALELRSPENVILSYGESGWHLRHSGDWTRALAVFSAMRDRLDLAWMELEAKKRGQSAMLEHVTALHPLPGRDG